MKAVKLALIGTAALAAVSVSARADDLNALKAQIETLNARMATLEASPSVPAGFQAVSFTKNEKGEHVISIMPTADAPASATIVWSGYVRAAIVSYRDRNTVAGPGNAPPVQDVYATDVRARAGISVTGTTDTAVGEVGVTVNLLASTRDAGGVLNSGNGAVTTDGFRGWWKMTPNLTLSAGTMGTLAKSSYSFDAICTCAYNDGFGGISPTPFFADPIAIRLGYADGPLSLAVELEDSNNGGNNSAVGVTAKGGYKADIFGLDIAGGYWGHATGQAAWSVSGGVGVNLNVVSLGAAVGTGNNGSFVTAAFPAANVNWTIASAYATASLNDALSIQLGVAHDFTNVALAADRFAGATEYNAGIYYTPVKQLTFGLEGNYWTGGAIDQSYTAALVSWFRF